MPHDELLFPVWLPPLFHLWSSLLKVPSVSTSLPDYQKLLCQHNSSIPQILLSVYDLCLAPVFSLSPCQLCLLLSDFWTPTPSLNSQWESPSCPLHYHLPLCLQRNWSIWWWLCHLVSCCQAQLKSHQSNKHMATSVGFNHIPIQPMKHFLSGFFLKVFFRL